MYALEEEGKEATVESLKRKVDLAKKKELNIYFIKQKLIVVNQNHLRKKLVDKLNDVRATSRKLY